MPARRRWIKPKQAPKVAYQRYIHSKKWERRREAYFDAFERACHICGATTKVQLHHKTYERMGAELDSDLVPLCSMHHRELHKFHDQRRAVNKGWTLLQSSDLFLAIKQRTRRQIS